MENGVHERNPPSLCSAIACMAVIRRRERRRAREKRRKKFWVRKIFQNRAELGNSATVIWSFLMRRHFPNFSVELWDAYYNSATTYGTRFQSQRSPLTQKVIPIWSLRSLRSRSTGRNDRRDRIFLSQRSSSQRSLRSPDDRFPYDRWDGSSHFSAIVGIIWESGLFYSGFCRSVTRRETRVGKARSARFHSSESAGV